MSDIQPVVIQQSRLVSRSPIYYGWIIMFVGTFGMIMTAPGQTYAVSIFIEYFIHDLNLSRSLVSSMYTAGTLVGSLVLPFVGRLIDRSGPRKTMSVILILFGGACFFMGIVFNAWMLAVGFLFIRMLGQGSLMLVSKHVVNQWWVKRRGTIMGISGMIVSLLGLGGFPGLINWLIPIYGWQATYMILGMILLGFMLPLTILLVRDRPENYGLLPDGEKLTDTNEGAQRKSREQHWTLPEARTTAAFWVTSTGVAAIGMLSTALFFHMVSIFQDSGLSANTAAWVYLPIAVTTALVSLGSGILVDRIPPNILLALALFLQALSLWMAQYLSSITMAVGYGIILGTTMALMATVHSVAWASYFGRNFLGSISGMATSILIVGSALGPMPFGIARDLFGNYSLILNISAFIPFALGILSLFTKNPNFIYRRSR